MTTASTTKIHKAPISQVGDVEGELHIVSEEGRIAHRIDSIVHVGGVVVLSNSYPLTTDKSQRSQAMRSATKWCRAAVHEYAAGVPR